MPNRPLVHFVGAGPGDPGLISVRGARCLSRADVIVYDRLVPEAILRYAKSGAERIDVGRAAPQAKDRDAIAYLLVEKQREGKRVVRLKWGDPFVFDDGGEEALFLHEHGVPFEVVPGIPAAVAVPAYAGVAVTYRGGGDTLTFIRGHEDASHDAPPVDWSSLARLDGTVVCYADRDQANVILSSLVAAGRPAAEPAALVYRGTLAGQHTITGTLGELASTAPPSPDPAIVIVGRVAGLRQHLRWFDVRPLFGQRIVVTRPREQAHEMVEALEDLGAHVIQAPSVRIVAAGDDAPLTEACADLSRFSWLVLPNTASAEAFLRVVLAAADIRQLKGVGICAIGQASVERFAQFGVRVDVPAVEYRPELLVAALSTSGPLEGSRILVPKGEGTRDLLAEVLRDAGAEVTEVPAYRTVPIALGDPREPDLYRMLLEKEIDVVAFTSASTVRDYVELYGADPLADLLGGTTVACIGPVTAEVARTYGIDTAILPEEYTIAGLIDAIVRHYASSGAETAVGS
ncbi:MAG: uroporphyrinogen-III C-methyltransferase [Acidobacteriota bacterium]